MAVYYDDKDHKWKHGREETQAPEEFVHEAAEVSESAPDKAPAKRAPAKAVGAKKAAPKRASK